MLLHVTRCYLMLPEGRGFGGPWPGKKADKRYSGDVSTQYSGAAQCSSTVQQDSAAAQSSSCQEGEAAVSAREGYSSLAADPLRAGGGHNGLLFRAS